MRLVFLVVVGFIFSCSSLQVDQFNDSTGDKFLSNIRYNTPKLTSFLYDFPKGADLHTHASGAAYIEYALIDAADKNFFYDIETLTIFKEDSGRKYVPYAVNSPQQRNGKCSGSMKGKDCIITVKELLERNKDLEAYLDVVSARGWHKNTSNGQDHFFNAFEYADVPDRKNNYIARMIARSHDQGIRYIEIMTSSVDSSISKHLRKLVPDTVFDINDLEASYQKISEYLHSEEFERSVKTYTDARENAVEDILRTQYGITSVGEHPDIIVRYMPQLYRMKSLHTIFIDAAINMRASVIDNRIVAINLVQNEASLNSLVNFEDQMKILDFFWQKYQQPNIALHAGELVLRESPVEPMRDRISKSILNGHASRIGHGISIGWERDTQGTLTLMRDKKVAVEICLSSNDMILGITGDDHPLALYLESGVPVTIATDDEGIARSNITMEYIKAAQIHKLSYSTLKKIAQNGIEYSFLEGKSIYNESGNILNEYVNYLSSDLPKVSDVGAKAYLQIRHEKDLQLFEKKMSLR